MLPLPSRVFWVDTIPGRVGARMSRWMKAGLVALGLSSSSIRGAWATELSFPDIDGPLQLAASNDRDAAVVFGNEDYETLPDVPYAERDARAVEGFLRYTRGLPPDRISLVVNGTHSQMQAALTKAAAQAKPGGTVWVYFSGQGGVDLSTNSRVLLGIDAPDTPKAVAGWGVSVPQIEATVHQPGRRTLVILDTSFKSIGRDDADVFTRFRYDPLPLASFLTHDMMVWVAAAPDQHARKLDATEHGLFTYYAVGAMRGWADGVHGDGTDAIVTLEEAHTYVLGQLGRATEFAVKPTLERGGSARGWELSRGAMEEGPQPVEDDSVDFDHTSNIKTSRDDLQRAGAVRAASRSLQKEAADRWVKVAQVAASGGRRAERELEQFIEQYEDATVTVDGREVAVTIEQVSLAEQMLARLQGRDQ